MKGVRNVDAIIVTGSTAEEIAALVLAVQERQDVKIAIQGAEAVTIEDFQRQLSKLTEKVAEHLVEELNRSASFARTFE